MDTKRKILSKPMRENIQIIQNDHFLAVREFKNEFLKCIDTALSCENEVITFELQHPFEMPFISIDNSYEWHQLWCSNLCVYDEIRNKPFMYFWDESIAIRGPEDIASCLYKYILTQINASAKKLIIYSKDSPLYRNVKISLMLVKLFDYLKSSPLEIIEQRFFISGHDKNACINCFDIIDKKRKTIDNVFVPSDWINVISNAKNEPKFAIKKMESTDFYSCQNILQNIENLKLDLVDVKRIIYNRKNPLLISTCNSTGVTNTYPINDMSPNAFQKSLLNYSNEDGHEISKFKYDSLQKILGFIPSEHHKFYKSLKNNENIPNVDLALASHFEDKNS